MSTLIVTKEIRDVIEKANGLSDSGMISDDMVETAYTLIASILSKKKTK